MKITSITCSGLRGVPDRRFDFTNPATGQPLDAVLITGPMGSGKTRLLEAIMAAKEDVQPYAFRPSASAWLRPGEDVAKITVDWWLTEDERQNTGAAREKITSETILGTTVFGVLEHDPALQMILGQYDQHPSVGKLEYFHARRHLPPSSAALGRPRDVDAERRVRLDKRDDKYMGLRQFLVELCVGLHETADEPDADQAGAARFTKAFSELCKGKVFEGISMARDGRIRVRFRGAGGEEFDLDELSDGEKQAAIFAGTFLHLGLNHSVVFIDRPELHVSEGDAPAFFSAIGRLGHDNQVFAATGSPGVLAAAAPYQVIRLG